VNEGFAEKVARHVDGGALVKGSFQDGAKAH
jgi:hypothetical protein